MKDELQRLTAALLLFASPALAVASEPWPFPWPEDRIAHYAAHRAAGPIAIDGRLDEADWKAAPRSPRFSDLVRGAPGIHDTRAAVLWDDQNLYVGYWVEEPFVEGTLTERDALIYKNNDVELAIPWQGLAHLARPDGHSLPPKDGDAWRMDFSRFNQYKEAPPAKDPGGWAWSPHGAWDSHIPEVFPYVHFSARPVGEAGATSPRSAPSGKRGYSAAK
jgi:hypothetical protein